MLTAAVVEQNLSFSREISEKGKKLIPVQGSMLEQVVSPSIPVLDYKEITAEGLCKLIEATTFSNLEESSQHSTISGEVVDKLSGLVRNHIKVAKEIVLPVVKSVTEKVIEYDNQLKMYNTLTDITIVPLSVSNLAKNTDILDMLERYEGATPIFPATMNLGPMTKEEILLNITTGNNRLDNEIIEAFSKLDASVITDTYNLFFNYHAANVGPETIEQTNAFEQFNKALLGFLLARKLFDAVHAGANGMNLASYQNQVAAIRDYCGALVHKALSGIDYDMKSERVIIGLDKQKRIIKVNALMFRQWLENNTEEAILGCLVSERPYVTLPMITEKKEQLVEAWNNYRTYLTLRKTQDNTNNLKNFIGNIIFVSISEGLTELENEYIKVNPNHVKTAQDLASEFADKLTVNDLDNLPEVCLALVTKCRFYFTSAYDILNGMHEVEKINPEISPREAALIAIIYYVTDFFISQVKVEQLV